jgi:hypothetical protein
MRIPFLVGVLAAACVGVDVGVSGQEYGKADREGPGDEMIQRYLAAEAEKIEASFLGEIKTKAQWEKERPRLMGEYFHMLGLSPLPEKTALKATITRTLDRGDYFVDMLHYQSSGSGWNLRVLGKEKAASVMAAKPTQVFTITSRKAHFLEGIAEVGW